MMETCEENQEQFRWERVGCKKRPNYFMKKHPLGRKKLKTTLVLILNNENCERTQDSLALTLLIIYDHCPVHAYEFE